MATIETKDGRPVSYDGREAVEVFRAKVMASGLRLYAKTGMKPNRMYTPTAMMRCAAEITGRKFKARDYAGAAAALDDYVVNALTDGSVEVVER